MVLAIPKLATAELVATAWIKSAVTAYDVATGTTLQGPNSDTGVLSWGTTGFVTTMCVGGSPSGTTPVRQSVMEVDVFATRVDGNGKPAAAKPPWGRANMIAEVIIAAHRTLGWGTPWGPVTMPAGFPPVRVMDVGDVTEPERVRSDEANYAQYRFQLTISWMALT